MRERTISREHRYRGVSITKLCGIKGYYFPWSCIIGGDIVTGRTKKEILHKIDLILGREEMELRKCECGEIPYLYWDDSDPEGASIGYAVTCCMKHTKTFREKQDTIQAWNEGKVE